MSTAGGLLLGGVLVTVAVSVIVWARRIWPDRASAWSSRRKRLTDDVLNRMDHDRADADGQEHPPAGRPDEPIGPDGVSKGR